MKSNALPFLLPVRSIVFILVFIVCAWIAKTDVGQIGHWWSIIAVLVNILTILLLIYVAHKNGKTFGQLINYQKGSTRLFDGRYILYRFLSFLPLTIILCWYYYMKRNPVPIMVGHAVIDLATAAQIVATSTGPGLYETMCGM